MLLKMKFYAQAISDNLVFAMIDGKKIVKFYNNLNFLYLF